MSLGVMHRLRLLFALHLFWDGAVSPNLSVRMWIAGAHHRAAVFEDLDVMDVRARAQFAILLGPEVHDSSDLLLRHLRQRQVMSRRKTQDAANAGLGLGDAERTLVISSRRNVGLEGCEIIFENVRGGVRRITQTAGPLVAGTQITTWVVGRSAIRGNFVHRALPRTLRAMRRNQEPLAFEWVPPPVRIAIQFFEVHRAHTRLLHRAPSWIRAGVTPRDAAQPVPLPRRRLRGQATALRNHARSRP